jgi:hypothetical protein
MSENQQLTVTSTAGVAIGCPGGPGHPSGASQELVLGTVADIVEAVEYLPRFLHDVKPGLLVVCQCELAEIIQVMAGKLAATKP